MVGLRSTMVSKRETVETKPHQLRLTWRIALSFLLLVHLAAVFVPPFRFATSSGPGLASPFAEPLMQVLRPYVELLFLDHGYFFFAPNPGPSHLLRARLEFADGGPPEELTFPDRNRQRPRLLYHRHFMLAEQLHSDFIPLQPPPEVAGDASQAARWQQTRQAYEARRKSFEDHLRSTYGASKVTLTRLEHTLYGPAAFQNEAKPLNAADSYRELSDETTEVTPTLPRPGP